MPLITRVAARLHETPLRHTFATARDVLARQVSRQVVVEIVLEDGTVAVGEAVPVAYVTGETPESVMATVEDAGVALRGAGIRRLRPLLEDLRDRYPHSPTAIASLEIGLYSALAKVRGLSLWEMFGGAVQEVETDLTLSIVPDALDRAREAAEIGFRHFKVKVGSGDSGADFERLRELHATLPGGRFRVDANQAFTPDEALRFVDRVQAAGIPLDLVEQPTPKDDLESLDFVASRSPVPVFADESVKSPSDALRVVSETRAHGINVKLMKSGISGALDIIAIARASGRKLMIGCMLESRRGIAASLALACGTGAFDFVDLDSHLLLREEGENPWFAQDGPLLRIPDHLTDGR